ncbi:MAG: GntR family transcriptional regulator [Nitratireductor sp.]
MSKAFDEKIKPQSLVDVVTERLAEAIVEGTLVPGSRLSEQALAASMGVSRGPLREAIRRLEGRRLLERVPNIGVRVSKMSANDLRQILEVREVLEGLACGLAAQKMSDEELDDLERLLDEHGKKKGVKGGEGYYQEARDFDFHFRVAKGSGNERLVSLLCEDLYDLLRVYRYKLSTVDQRSATALAEHRKILAAMRKRDFAIAEAAMREHIRTARMHVDTLVRSDIINEKDSVE